MQKKHKLTFQTLWKSSTTNIAYKEFIEQSKEKHTGPSLNKPNAGIWGLQT